MHEHPTRAHRAVSIKKLVERAYVAATESSDQALGEGENAAEASTPAKKTAKKTAKKLSLIHI